MRLVRKINPEFYVRATVEADEKLLRKDRSLKEDKKMFQDWKKIFRSAEVFKAESGKFRNLNWDSSLKSFSKSTDLRFYHSPSVGPASQNILSRLVYVKVSTQPKRKSRKTISKVTKKKKLKAIFLQNFTIQKLRASHQSRIFNGKMWVINLFSFEKSSYRKFCL